MPSGSHVADVEDRNDVFYRWCWRAHPAPHRHPWPAALTTPNETGRTAEANGSAVVGDGPRGKLRLKESGN